MGCHTTSNVSQLSTLSTRRILVVDDDLALLEILPRTISVRIADVSVMACDSAEAALKHLVSDRYDLVITDLNMPRMNGMALIREIKTRFPTMAILVMTGHGAEQAQQQAMQAGVEGFILKPFDRKEFSDAIERILEQHARE